MNEDEETLCEIIFGNKVFLFLLCALPLLSGCGRKWEQFWGQDTKPEVRYKHLYPGQVEFPITTLNPTQFADKVFRDARFLSVWACTDTDVCVGIPKDDGNSSTVYVITEGSVLSVYNAKLAYPLATKIKVEYVL